MTVLLVFSKPNCPKCDRLKAWLKERGLLRHVKLITVDTDPKERSHAEAIAASEALAAYYCYHQPGADPKNLFPAACETETGRWAGGFLAARKLIKECLQGKND